MVNELRQGAHQCLLLEEVDEKLAAVRELVRMQQAGALTLAVAAGLEPVMQPGRPVRPELIRAGRVKRRGFGTREGRATMMHAIAHIEFNAINLALDAVSRFSDMPASFYTDWLNVAHEEVYHFELIRAHLRHLGADYGDYPAHGGLWEMCEKTAHDVLSRMALVPRVLEARGLDVTPGIQEKLAQAGDHHAVSLLDIIMRDEVGHVAVGNHWFNYLCGQRGLDPFETFTALIGEYYPRGLAGPYNMLAREQAGFSAQEMTMLGCASDV
ncbi:ferritin-like domain-containing protein [Mariprofundus erugo]|uniref:ferritin-like domain-containing protein n=1 Tax=Mariprofundus erugo TaxID=2528639 RepID=UPI0010FDFDA1|nr:ferritin-like domain-containing protein [Mariprofundus erugo]